MQLQYSQAESMHATGVHDSFKWHLSWAKNKNPSAIGARRGRLACSDSTYVLVQNSLQAIVHELQSLSCDN